MSGSVPLPPELRGLEKATSVGACVGMPIGMILGVWIAIKEGDSTDEKVLGAFFGALIGIMLGMAGGLLAGAVSYGVGRGIQAAGSSIKNSCLSFFNKNDTPNPSLSEVIIAKEEADSGNMPSDEEIENALKTESIHGKGHNSHP